MSSTLHKTASAGSSPWTLRGRQIGYGGFLGKPVDGEDLVARMRSALLAKSWTDELEPREAALVSFAIALEAKDEYTRGHSERVGWLARNLGATAGVSETQQRDLQRAGLLHDVGKIGIPGDCLRLSRPLTREEFEIVKRHSAIGYDICKPLKSLIDVLPLVRGHHERLDGSGYPDGLKGDQISRSLHCLIVADCYDALTTPRPYRRALSDAEAFTILRAAVAQGQLDGPTVELLLSVKKTPC